VERCYSTKHIKLKLYSTFVRLIHLSFGLFPFCSWNDIKRGEKYNKTEIMVTQKLKSCLMVSRGEPIICVSHTFVYDYYKTLGWHNYRFLCITAFPYITERRLCVSIYEWADLMAENKLRHFMAENYNQNEENRNAFTYSRNICCILHSFNRELVA
jgi:hypothetical protein